MATFNFGERQSVETWGRGVQLSADGFPKAKAGGAEFKWSTIDAHDADVYLFDQLSGRDTDPQTGALSTDNTSVAHSDAVVIPAGTKFLRYGTPIMRDTDGKFVVATGDVSAKRGEIYLVNETITEDDAKSPYPIAIDGGRVFKARILSSTAADFDDAINGDVIGYEGDFTTAVTMATLNGAALPTLEQILAALPGISLAQD